MNITASFVKCYRYIEKNAVFRKKNAVIYFGLRFNFACQKPIFDSYQPNQETIGRNKERIY